MEQKGLELTNLHSNYIKLQENIHSLEVVNLKLRKKYKSEEENKINSCTCSLKISNNKNKPLSVKLTLNVKR